MMLAVATCFMNKVNNLFKVVRYILFYFLLNQAAVAKLHRFTKHIEKVFYMAVV